MTAATGPAGDLSCEVVPADRLHAGRLRAAVPGLLAESHLVTDFQMFEFRADEAVAMEIDFPALWRVDPSVIGSRIDDRDRAVRRHLVRLDVTPPLADRILHLAARSPERIANRDVHVLVGMVFGRLTIDDDFASGHPYVDRYVEETAYR